MAIELFWPRSKVYGRDVLGGSVPGIKRPNCVFDLISIEAEWWIPKTPEIRVRGTLSGRVASDLLLVTEGNLGDDFHCRENNMIVLGESRNGERYTLLNCFSTKRVNNWDPSQADATYFSNWLLVGEHFADYEDLVFDRIYFGISNLEEWQDTKAFSPSFDRNTRTARIEYVNPNSITILESEKIIAKLEYSYRPSGMCIAQQSATIEHAARIDLRSSSPLPLFDYSRNSEDSFFECLQRIKSFVEFGIGTNVFPYDIRAYSHKFPEQADPKYLRPIQVYPLIRVPSNTEPVPFHKMLFTWARMQKGPQKHIQAWERTVRSIGMPVWLYLGSFREQLFEDQRFLELVQALEGFHRYRYPAQSEKSSEHIQRVTRILEACTEEDRTWLEGKLEYSHEPSLRNRLKELFEVHKGIVTWLTGSWKNAKDFVGLIVDNRNRHAHCLHDKPFNGLRRNRTIRVMQAVLAMLLLEEAKFSNEQIEGIIKSNWGYSQLQKRLQSDTESQD